MIIGLGSDIVNIERIGALLDKSGDKFKNRTFTTFEISSAEKYTKKQQINAHFAKRFAAKEAFAKAAGTGFGKHLNFKDIGVANDKKGKPLLMISKKTKAFLTSLAFHFSPHDISQVNCHLSLSDDHPFAIAVVIIEISSETS
jgi:holo-[acyl-carrier protein] synthase